MFVSMETLGVTSQRLVICCSIDSQRAHEEEPQRAAGTRYYPQWKRKNRGNELEACSGKGAVEQGELSSAA